MNKLIRFGVLATAVIAISAWAPQAAAKCGGSGKSIFTYPSAGACGYYCQVNDPAFAAGTSTVHGDYWVIGAGVDDPPRATCNTVGAGADNGNYEADGTCGQAPWYADAGPGKLNIGIDTDGGNTDGCPAPGAHVAVAFSDRNAANSAAFFGVAVCSMSAANTCDLGVGGILTMAQIPKPTVTFTSKAGAALTLNLAVPALPSSSCVDGTGGGHCPGGVGTQAIQGYDVYRFERPRSDATTDNNRLRSAWTLVGTIGNTGGPVTFTCTDTVNANARLGLVPRLDSGFKPDFVGSGSSRVECNPTLADPGTKYKIIDKKPTTTKTPVKQ